MKARDWSRISLLVVLMLVGAWLAFRQQQIHRLEEESQVLSERIAQVDFQMPQRVRSGSLVNHLPASKLALQRFKSISHDWDMAYRLGRKKMSGEEDSSVRGDLLMQHLQFMIERMDAAELEAALESPQRLNSDRCNRWIRKHLLSGLYNKNPALALQRFWEPSDRFSRDIEEVAAAVRKWTEQDPVGAMAWVEAHTANGDFETKGLHNPKFTSEGGHNDQYQAALMAPLLAQDPAAAARHLQKIPQAQRDAILWKIQSKQLAEGGWQAYADLVRGHASDAEAVGMLVRLAGSTMMSGGCDQMKHYLDEIAASPSERAAIAQAAKGFHWPRDKGLADHYHETRKWLGEVVPNQADEIIAQLLASHWQRGEREGVDMMEWVREIHSNGENDAALSKLSADLKSHGHPDDARRIEELRSTSAHLPQAD